MVEQVIMSLSRGESKHIQLKIGRYLFKIKVIDAIGDLVEVYKCRGGSCTLVAGEIGDTYGYIMFNDEVNGINPYVYNFKVNDEDYGNVVVSPIIIDVNEITEKTIRLMETLLLARRLKL